MKRIPFATQNKLSQVLAKFGSDSTPDFGPKAAPPGGLGRHTRQHRGSLACIPAVISIFALVAMAGGLVGFATPAWAGPPTITSVSFTGTSAAPTITVSGSGFGHHPPAVAKPSCYLGTPTSGEDYKNQKLSLTDVPGGWYAGDQTDCVTIRTVSYTPTKVVFTLGGFYTSSGWVLNQGDTYIMYVGDVTYTGTVEYQPPTISGVSFNGTSADPTVTVNGSGFGIAPSTASPGCDTSGTDYANDDLYIVDNTASWKAGEAGTCASLANVSWSNTQVTFNLSGMYGTTCCGVDWVLNPGDNVTMYLLGASDTLTVEYPPPTISSVIFSGWSGSPPAPSAPPASGPTITVNGSGFGIVPPTAAPGCDASGTEISNDDLWIEDNTESWTSGEPGSCVSLANVAWSNTQVVFSLSGSYGTTCCGLDWVLNQGDSLTVQLVGGTYTATVGYPTSSTQSRQSPNWAGYVDTGETYTYVSGSWTVPASSCNTIFSTEFSSSWVGIDGDGNNTVEQIGTNSTCVPHLLGNGSSYGAWWEMYPENSQQGIPESVNAGDVMNASVQYSGTSGGNSCYLLKLQDQTQGWNYSTNQCQPGTQNATAEWITEDTDTSILGLPSFPLAPFGTMTFTNCDAGGSDAAVYGAPISYHPNTAVTLDASAFNDGNAAASVSGLSNDGSQFSITWQHG